MIIVPPIVGYTVISRFISAFATMIVAVWIEHGRSNKASVGVVILGLTSMFLCTGVDVFVLPLLLIYFSSGIHAYLTKNKRIFFLFSARSYSVLLVAIAVTHLQVVQLILPTINILRVWWFDLALVSTGFILLVWVAGIPIVYFFSWITKKRKK
jgi:hypothetical protein